MSSISSSDLATITRDGWKKVDDFGQIIHNKGCAILVVRRHEAYWYKEIPYDQTHLGISADLMIVDDPLST